MHETNPKISTPQEQALQVAEKFFTLMSRDLKFFYIRPVPIILAKNQRQWAIYRACIELLSPDERRFLPFVFPVSRAVGMDLTKGNVP